MSTNSNQIFTPPQDKTAEESVLGLILLNGKILDDIVDKLKIDFFYDPKHQLIFRICLDLWSSNKPVDTFLVLKELEKDKYKERMKDEEDKKG